MSFPFGLIGKVVGGLGGQARPYAARVGGAGVAALAGLLVTRYGIPEEMAAEGASAVLVFVTLVIYALTHKTTSKVINPDDTA